MNRSKPKNNGEDGVIWIQQGVGARRNTVDRKGHGQGESVYYYFVPPTLQHDPCPDKTLTSCETLKLYHRLSRGTCVIAPCNQLPFCKVKFLPFSPKSPNLTSRLGTTSLLLPWSTSIFRASEEQRTPYGWSY
ncbi:uncharacterized protein VP01_5371g2, partial [Puccinia sorghi]